MRLPLTLAFLAASLAHPAPAESPRTDLATAVLDRYENFSIPEKQAALSALVSHRETAAAVLDAMGKGRIPRSDLSGFAARQIAAFNDPTLSALLEKSWGRIGNSAPGTEEAAREHARLKALLTPDVLAKANVQEGRLLFKSVCATCHQLFEDGGHIGPNLTGSNRADLDYLLENITNPSAVLGRDYELHTFSLKDGRAVAGMIRKETDSALTIQTITSEEVIARSDIQSQENPGISMMPAGLLTGLSPSQARDLVAYLASPQQVPLPGEGPPPPATVPGAIEGESLKVLAKTGEVAPQDMRNWKDSTWSAASQLWWTGGKPGDQLTLALPIPSDGTYEIFAVLTRAPDYGTVRFSLDGKALGDSRQIDLFGSKVTATTEIFLGKADLTAGDHRLSLTITGAHPDAIKSYMAGLDYIRLQKTR